MKFVDVFSLSYKILTLQQQHKARQGNFIYIVHFMHMCNSMCLTYNNRKDNKELK